MVILLGSFATKTSGPILNRFEKNRILVGLRVRHSLSSDDQISGRRRLGRG